jgi:endoglucanase
MNTGIAYTQGARFMADGKPLRLRGLGVGTWLNLEHFMLGVPGWDGEIRACFNRCDPHLMNRFTEAFFTAEDAAYIRSLGINFIRVPINHHLFWNDDRDTENPYGFAQLERLAQLCEASGLYFLPDLHTTPGGQNPDWHSECGTGTPLFWQFEAFQNRAVKLWGAIAARLGKYVSLLGYDLLNEPVLPDGKSESLQGFYRDAIAAIRKTDTRHIVFLEGDRFSMDFTQVPPPDDGNWAYTYHFYPGVWNGRLVDPTMDGTACRTAMASALGDILTSMGDYHGPLLCGELGYELHCLDADFGIRLTGETLRAVEGRESSWCLWCYKDARFMGLVYPPEESGWMRLAREVGQKWNHHRAARLGSDMAEAIQARCPYHLTDEEKYRMQFVVRAMVAHADAAHILEPVLEKLPVEIRSVLAEDFAFHRCEKNAALEALLKKICAPAVDL